MQLYLIRHGETNWNKERRLQGQSDIPLNAFGRELALKTAQGLKDIKFDAVFSSPLVRARETADIIIGNVKVPFYEDERIQEMGFGDFEGLCCSKVGWNIPDPEFENFFIAPHKYKVPNGGESFVDLMDRVKSFFDDLFQNTSLKGGNILIATHGATLRAALDYFRDISLSDFWDTGVHKNCAVSIVNVTAEGPKVITENVVYYEDIVEPW